MPFLQTLSDGCVTLAIRLQPRAAKNQIVGCHDNRLKIRLTTPPVDGKANQALVTFLAKQLQIPRHTILLKNGLRNRNKQIIITGYPAKQIRQLLTLAL